MTEKIKGEYKNTEELVVIEPSGDTWTIRMPNALGFNESNRPYAYYIVQDREGESWITEEKDIDDRIGNGNKYTGSIENSGNYASNTDGLYTGGKLTNTLSGNAEFHVLKYWGDNGTEGRPSYQFDLYHYAEGGNYIHATPSSSDSLNKPLINSVENRGNGIVEYVFKTAEQGNTYNTLSDVSGLSEEEKNSLSLDSRTKYEYDFGISYLPKFDAAGYMYVYFVKEKQTDSSPTGHTYITLCDSSNETSPFKTAELLPQNYALNGGMLKNILSGNAEETASKTWAAESRQDRSDKASFIVDQYRYLLNNDGGYRYENLDGSFQEITSSYEKMYLLYDRDENGKFKVKSEDSYIYVNWSEITFDEHNNASVGGKNVSFAYKYVDDIYMRDENGNVIKENGLPQLKYDREVVVTELVNNSGKVEGSNQVRVLLKTKKDTTVYDTYAKEKVTFTEYEADGVTVKSTYEKEQYKLNHGGEFIYRDWDEIYEIDPINGTAKVIVEEQEYLEDETATQSAQQAENELALSEGREPETVDSVYRWVTTKKEVSVKLVYNQLRNIYLKNSDGQYTTTPMAKYRGEGKVVWLDPDMSKKVSGIEESDGFTSTFSVKDKYINTVSGYTVSDGVITYNNTNSVPSTEFKEGYYTIKDLEGFSQDIKSVTETLVMPKYDDDGYEYIYKIYEGNVKTKDDAEYAKSEKVTDSDGNTYYLITTDKGYTYESRETFENGNSVVRNQLVGYTCLQTNKSFIGNFPTGDFVIKYNVYRNGIRIGQTEMTFNCYGTGIFDETHNREITRVVPTGVTQQYSSDGTMNLNQYNFTPNSNIIQGTDYYTLNEGTSEEVYAFNRYTQSGASYNYEIIEAGMYYAGTDTIVKCMKNESLVTEEHEIGDRYGSDKAYLVVRDEVENIVGDKDREKVEGAIYKEWRDENQDLYRLPVRAKLQYCKEVSDGVASWTDVHTYTISPSERFKEFEFERIGTGENAEGEKIPGTNLFVVDELKKWLEMKKTDENGNTVYETVIQEDGTQVQQAVLEDRFEVKCGDTQGNFRVIETAVQEKDGSIFYVEHEGMLVNAELVQYLKNNIGNIRIFLNSYVQNNPEDARTAEFVEKHITMGDDLESCLKNFIDSHSDKHIEKYLWNNIRTADDSQEITEKYADLGNVFRAFLGIYYTEEFHKFNRQNEEFKAYYLNDADFMGAYSENIAAVGIDAVLEAIETGENGIQTVQSMIRQYVGTLSNEHHSGYSFIQTSDQNYDVSPYAEINFEMVK